MLRVKGRKGRDTRSVATGVSFQGDSGASQRKRRYGMWLPNDAERLPCNEGREEFKERYRDGEKSSEWTLERIREAYEKVARDEIRRMGVVQEILRKSTDILRRVIAPVGGKGGVTLS